MNTDFVVSFPIYGYNGMGYSNRSSITKAFKTEREARKYAKHVDTAWKIHEGIRTKEIPFMSDRQEAFLREMEENVSFGIKGPATILKRQITYTAI